MEGGQGDGQVQGGAEEGARVKVAQDEVGAAVEQQAQRLGQARVQESGGERERGQGSTISI